MPPLKLPVDDDEGLIVVPIDKTFTDGDEKIWPKDSRFQTEDPRVYLMKLANMWMKEKGEARPGRHYILDDLPEGYVYKSRARIQNPEIRDKYLYGHPSGYYYNSPNRFWSHFYFLMTHGASSCRCDLCKLQQKQLRRGDGSTMARPRGKPGLKLKSRLEVPYTFSNGTVGRPGRPKTRRHFAVDEEGTPDVFKTLVAKLKQEKEKSLDEPVQEPLSMDWKAEHTQLQEHLTRIFMQHSFIPRVGELVLWCYNHKQFKGTELKFNLDTDCFEMYCRKRKKFLGMPKWRAGTVAQAAEEPPILEDIIMETEKKSAVNISGFRIETFLDPNGIDKNLSHQYEYVPLSYIRPLNYWQIFLQGIEPRDYHPSIQYALTIMPSFSLLDKYHFKGKWPNATVYCKGIFIGSELLIKGDGVRLMPRSELPTQDSLHQVTDVLVIKNIKVNLINCDDDPASPLLSKSTAVRLVGKAYTLLPRNAYQGGAIPLTDAEVINSFECVGMRGYGTWYPMHPPNRCIEISLDQVIGRCYESELMTLMFDDLSLGLDREGVIDGRNYGRVTDQRLAEGKQWFCGDSRIETLALETLNGQDVGMYDDVRDVKLFRAHLHILNGNPSNTDITDAKVIRKMGRRSTGLIGGKKGTSGFEGMGKMSTMVTSALGPLETANPSPMDLTSAAVSDVESREDEDEEITESDESDLKISPVPPLRGGTEESPGGDYSPNNGPKTKRVKLK
ncbi:hypothetical protein AJ79_03177 [Helicocarpus griseus UAMH5409]|uniref:Cryptic loci regulator 2 N-terminal domain-containing protein n=1 Tax=Helicocarpus griseus UAMH5409 TaxID=1447875 RepID=A0A2B7XR08_9EURO|nr:hypothetical protein AJ79_03177 [Helicocarpus griseus UAMH5409]